MLKNDNIHNKEALQSPLWSDPVEHTAADRA